MLTLQPLASTHPLLTAASAWLASRPSTVAVLTMIAEQLGISPEEFNGPSGFGLQGFRIGFRPTRSPAKTTNPDQHIAYREYHVYYAKQWALAGSGFCSEELYVLQGDYHAPSVPNP